MHLNSVLFLKLSFSLDVKKWYGMYAWLSVLLPLFILFAICINVISFKARVKQRNITLIQYYITLHSKCSKTTPYNTLSLIKQTLTTCSISLYFLKISSQNKNDTSLLFKIHCCICFMVCLYIVQNFFIILIAVLFSVVLWSFDTKLNSFRVLVVVMSEWEKNSCNLTEIVAECILCQSSDKC